MIPRKEEKPSIGRQLRRAVSEGRPGACTGYGFEKRCTSEDCAVLRKSVGSRERTTPEYRKENVIHEDFQRGQVSGCAPGG